MDDAIVQSLQQTHCNCKQLTYNCGTGLRLTCCLFQQNLPRAAEGS